MQIKQKEEREKEIKEKLEQQKQKELEERRRFVASVLCSVHTNNSIRTISMLNSID